jgi:hypothetical protein
VAPTITPEATSADRTSPSGVASTPVVTFRDPFAYCAAVGTIDQPDARYTGEQVPESVARGLMKAVNAPPNAPLDPFLRASFWRCMDGKVYACTVGANLPCQAKADLSRSPSAAMVDFCRQNPESEVIPAVVTGRMTVYQWRCRGGAPEIVRQVAQPDARGFLSGIWHEISPS